MKTLLTCNLSTGDVTSGGNAWTPRPLVYGESITLALRFLETDGTVDVEPDLDIAATKAAIGVIDARPAEGRWALQVGDGASTSTNTTALVDRDCDAGELQAALAALTDMVTAHGAPVVAKLDGSWVIVFGTGAASVPLTVRHATLLPLSIGRITASTLDGVWRHEVRLVVAPLAFTDVAARVLPPAPSTSYIRHGAEGDGFKVNTIQALLVPPDFRGSYYLVAATGQTSVLSQDDGPDTVAAALNTLLGPGSVTVTDAGNFTGHIEFTGLFAGHDVALLTVTALAPVPGDLTFTLTLDDAALLARLRAEPVITAPLEVRISVTEEGGTVREHVAIRQLVTIGRPLVFPELATVPSIDWLRPASPKDYAAFSPDTVITGHQFNRAVVGDGGATVFVFAHGLGTDEYFTFVRETTSPGRQLVHGTDYSVTGETSASVTVTALLGTPGADGWTITVFSAQTVAAFADGLHVTLDQVTGLVARLNATDANVATLLALAGTTPLGTALPAAGGVTITLPDWEDAFPGSFLRDDGSFALPSPLPALGRAGWLLPAIHKASLTATVSALPTLSGTAGNVYQATAPILIPGGGRTRSTTVPTNGFFGSDGRRFYPLSLAAGTLSYFPADYERTLWEFETSAEMLRAGTTLSASFDLAYQLLSATTEAQTVLVIEHGAITSDATPTGSGSPPIAPAPNLGEVVWNATPLLSQRLILGPARVTGGFGVQIVRASDGTLSANKQRYGFQSGAGSAPASADFALRARLINFDTRDSVANATGLVHFQMTTGLATIG